MDMTVTHMQVNQSRRTQKTLMEARHVGMTVTRVILKQIQILAARPGLLFHHEMIIQQ
jgi:hypothetical protein